MKFLICLFLFLASIANASMNVTLAWDPNPEPDIASYTIYYGTNSRTYFASTNVGNVTCATVKGLDPSQIYYFALTAWTASGLESDFSEEVTNIWLYCVSVQIQYSTNIAGPWNSLFKTNVVKNYSSGFFKTDIIPLWPSSIAPTEYCSNGISYKVPVDTNEYPVVVPPGPDVLTNRLRSIPNRTPREP